MIIKSSKSLGENYESISALAHSTGKPIFITKEGDGDLVLLSMEAFEKAIQNNKTVSSNDSPIESNPMARIMDRGGQMTEFELGQKLKTMYNEAPRGDQVAFIHLFGIMFADALSNDRLSKREILKTAGLPESYQTEISKGIRLAQYVTVKENFAF